MALRIAKVGEVVGREIVITAKPPGDLAAILTNLEGTPSSDPGPEWQMELVFGEKGSVRSIVIDLAPFLSAAQYAQSLAEPMFIARQREGHLPTTRLLVFRDRFFLTERLPKSEAEQEEAILRAKRLVYEEESELTSLRSYVANMEAAIEFQRAGPKREPIPDDVKMLVWSRDGGACVRCQSREKLHFDHIIPVVKGGSNDAANVQLLCQACNLKKSDRIAF